MEHAAKGLRENQQAAKEAGSTQLNLNKAPRTPKLTPRRKMIEVGMVVQLANQGFPYGAC